MLGNGRLRGRGAVVAKSRHCGGRLAMVLEGGYHTESLARSVHATLEVMAGADPQDPWAPGINEVEEAAGFHRDAFRED